MTASPCESEDAQEEIVKRWSSTVQFCTVFPSEGYSEALGSNLYHCDTKRDRDGSATLGHSRSMSLAPASERV